MSARGQERLFSCAVGAPGEAAEGKARPGQAVSGRQGAAPKAVLAKAWTPALEHDHAQSPAAASISQEDAFVHLQAPTAPSLTDLVPRGRMAPGSDN